MMKNKIFFCIALLFGIVSLISLPSCRKAPINGKLDAQWQIMKIEHIEEGIEWTPERRTYIDINLHVVNLRNVTQNENPGAVIAGNLNYDKDAATVTMDFPYNTEDEKLQMLQSWGIYSNPVIFHIVKLDGKQLILKSSESIITCRRY